MTKHTDLKPKCTAALVAFVLIWAVPLRGATRQFVFVLAPTWVYDFFPSDVPGAEATGIAGINNNYDIVGGFLLDGVARQFVLSGGVITELAVGGADATGASDINDSGTVVGFFRRSGREHAFQYSAGTYSEVPFPAAFPIPPGQGYLGNAQARGINTQGQIVGWFRVEEFSGASHLYSYLDGTYSVEGLYFSDVNDAGHVVGTDLRPPPDGIWRGFLLAAGVTTTIAQPGAAQTDPDAVNNLDTVVGHYVDPIDTSRPHGFVWTNRKSVSINYPGAASTEVAGINDAGIIVGHYQVGVNVHGFVGIPRSPVNVLVNGVDGPLTLDRTQPLRVDLAFHAPPSGALDPAELYIGVVTPFGVFWLDPTGAFVATPTRIFAGALPAFGPSPLIDLPNASAFAPGTYTWFLVVDDDINGVPNGVFYDVAQVTIH